MSVIYDYENSWFLAEPVMDGLEGAVRGSEGNLDCLRWGEGHMHVPALVCPGRFHVANPVLRQS